MAVGKPKFTYIEINGVDVTSYSRGWSITNTYGNVMIKSIKLIFTKKVDTILDFSEELNGQRVIIKRGEATGQEHNVLTGEVTNIKPLGKDYEVIASDRMYETVKTTVTTSYDKDIDPEQGVFSEIMKSLFNERTTILADSSSIQDSGNATIINKFSLKAANLFERMQTLSETINWQLFYDEDDNKGHYEPKGFTPFITTLVTGQNIVNTPHWDEDAENLYNEIEVRGATQTVETTDVGQIGVTSGFTQTDVLLQYKPISTKVYADATNPPTTLKTGGVERSSASFDYSVDVDRQKIIWNTSQFTPGASDYVLIEYSYPVPTPTNVKDATSIEKYSPDKDNLASKKKVVHKLDITTVDDSETYAWNNLNKHKDPILSAKLNVTNVTGLKVGQTVEVNDTTNNISGTFYLIKIKKRYPYRYDEITVVSNFVDSLASPYEQDKRLKRLEEQSLGEEEIIQNIILESAPMLFENREIKGYKRDVSPDTIWGRIPLTWGDGSLWQGGKTNSEVLNFLTPGKNEFKEYIYDTDYYDSVNSSGVTWDVSNNEIIITGALYSNVMALGSAFNTVTVNINSTNDFTFEISADNKSTWQEIGSDDFGSPVNLTSSDGTGIYYKISTSGGITSFASAFPMVFTSGDSITISTEKKTTGEITNPAIKILLE